MTAPDSPAVAAARTEARLRRLAGDATAADALDGLLAELAAPTATDVHRGREIAAAAQTALARLVGERNEARAQLAALPEWSCPACGATTRARMADHTPTEGSAP